MKRNVKVTLFFIVLGVLCSALFALGLVLGLKHKTIIVHVNFEDLTLSTPSTEAKYKFMPKEMSDYICDMCSELELDSDLPVSLLLNENCKFDPEAVHRNENGSFDIGLWQENDMYLYTVFVPAYWKFDIPFDPFNWKHNTYIALHLIKDLSETLKIQDEVIMAYNCGAGAVMNGKIPESTYTYLARAKNNLALLKGGES